MCYSIIGLVSTLTIYIYIYIYIYIIVFFLIFQKMFYTKKLNKMKKITKMIENIFCFLDFSDLLKK